MKRNNVSKVILFALMFLLVASLSPATAFTLSDDDDTSTETEDETESTHTDDDDKDHDLDEYRDLDGTVWIETDIMTVTLNPKLPIYQYWFEGDDNGSLARFMVSYMMIVEFEDSNADDVFQPDETIAFAPLDAFEWSLQTGKITNDLNEVTEVYASYTKGGLSYNYDDDWYEDWMPEIEEEEEDPVVLASDDHEFAEYAGMTLRFYGHVYTADHAGNITDDFGVESNYTIAGGMELKVDIEIGNFPFISETSKVAVLNYLCEDVASSGEYEHSFELHEDDGDNEIDSEDISDNYGVEFEDRDEDNNGEDDDVQQISVIDGTNNMTRGLYSWLDKAIITDLNGTETAVDVDTSYWTNGEGLLLFFAYPNFDGGSILHDPSLRLIASGTPITQPSGILNLPMETITLIGVASAIVVVGVAGFAMKRR